MSIKSKYEYENVESIDNELKCALCNAPFINPLSTPCRHAFCHQCINDWLAKNSSCPSCSSLLSNDDLKPMPLCVCNILDRLPVRCILCGQTGIKRNEFDYHIDEICPKSVVSCAAADVRCPWTGRANKMELHSATCNYELMRPILAGLITENDTLKWEHNRCGSQIKALESENKRLTKQSSTDTAKIKELDENVNFLTELICHRNVELDDTISRFEDGTWIDLRKKELTDLDMGIVVQKAMIDRHCTELQLQANQITCRGISILLHGLMNNITLVKLNLGHNPISDRGVHLLAQFLSKNDSVIQRLHLVNADITDQGIQYLAEMLRTNTTLLSLSIFENRISDQGVQMLCDALAQHNKSLKSLYLQSNPFITDASVKKLIRMLECSHSLEALDLRFCGLTLTGIQRLRESATRKHGFDLSI